MKLYNIEVNEPSIIKTNNYYVGAANAGQLLKRLLTINELMFRKEKYELEV